MTQEVDAVQAFYSELRDIKAHIDTLTRIERYKFWQELKAESKKLGKFNQHGFRVYSQNDQDGIIEAIFKNILDQTGPEGGLGTFIEFGCDNGIENNTHYLLTKGWKGVWIDVVDSHIDFVRKNFSKFIENGQLSVFNMWLDRENIDKNLAVCAENLNGEPEEYDLDLLSIDTDWNDIYLWEAIKTIKPKVVCIEYNGHIPPPTALKVPYSDSKDQQWDGSNCFGASLQAIYDMAWKKGYRLLTCSLAGTDAFFVHKEYLHYFFGEPHFIEDLYEPARFNLEFNLGHQSSPGKWLI